MSTSKITPCVNQFSLFDETSTKKKPSDTEKEPHSPRKPDAAEMGFMLLPGLYLSVDIEHVTAREVGLAQISDHAALTEHVHWLPINPIFLRSLAVEPSRSLINRSHMYSPFEVHPQQLIACTIFTTTRALNTGMFDLVSYLLTDHACTRFFPRPGGTLSLALTERRDALLKWRWDGSDRTGEEEALLKLVADSVRPDTLSRIDSKARQELLRGDQ